MNLKPTLPALTRRKIIAGAVFSLITLTTIAATNIEPANAKAPTGPQQHVTNIANSVIRLANSGLRGTQLHRKFVNLLSAKANMDAVAVFALGRYRRKLPASKSAKYKKLVKAYIAGLFVYYAKDFRGRGLQIGTTRKSGKSNIINSKIIFNGSSKPVIWRVYSRGNRHRVTDVNIRGVWLSIQMRQKFTQLLKRNNGDFDKLMAFLSEYKNWMPKG